MKEIRAMRAVKRETLRLIETFVNRAKDIDMVANQFVPPLLDAILVDYRSNIAEGNSVFYIFYYFVFVIYDYFQLVILKCCL